MIYLSTKRYDRLKALEDYGYPVKWELLRDKAVTVAGVGGVGSISVELLARVGIGKIFIMDFDIVEEENLNRLVYREEHIGRYKTDVLTEIIKKINPDVEIKPYNKDIMAFDFENTLEDILAKSDMGLMCLDNIPARQFFNIKCVKLKVPYIDSGLLRSGLGGYLHLVIPRETACYQCTGSVKVTSTSDVDGPDCSASMPTTVNIIASLQVQHLIRYFLNFGHIPDYLSYNGLTDENLELELKLDPNCHVCGSEGIS